MTKQWKRSLSQSDILSDGAPFDGSNIDAPISSRSSHDWDPQGRIDAPISEAGTDWSAKTPSQLDVTSYVPAIQSADATTQSASGTASLVSGSGIVQFGPTTTIDVKLDPIDGGEAWVDQASLQYVIDGSEITDVPLPSLTSSDGTVTTVTESTITPPLMSGFNSEFGIGLNIDFNTAESTSTDVDVSVRFANSNERRGVLLD